MTDNCLSGPHLNDAVETRVLNYTIYFDDSAAVLLDMFFRLVLFELQPKRMLIKSSIRNIF